MDLQKEYADAQPNAAPPQSGDLSSEYESAEPAAEEEGGDPSESEEYSAVKQNMDMGAISKMVMDKDYDSIGRYVAGLFNAIKK